MDSIVRKALSRAEEYLDRLDDLPVNTAPDPQGIRRHLQQTYSFGAPVAAAEVVDDVAGMLEK